MEEAAGDRPRTLDELQREHGLHVGARHGVPKGELYEQSPLRNYVRDLVLGYNDGLVSVYAVTAGVAGAAFTNEAILVTGVAAALAGAFSMGAGEYISTKSQAQFYRAERKLEEEHLEKWPELEVAELRASLQEKGFEPPLLDDAVKSIAADRHRFLEFMMREEFGVGKESQRSPWAAAWLVMLAFLAGAAFAVVPYAVTPAGYALGVSSGVSLLGLFLAGVIRARASRLRALPAGLEMVLIGVLAAAATYGVGRLVGTAV